MQMLKSLVSVGKIQDNVINIVVFSAEDKKKNNKTKLDIMLDPV